MANGEALERLTLTLVGLLRSSRRKSVELAGNASSVDLSARRASRSMNAAVTYSSPWSRAAAAAVPSTRSCCSIEADGAGGGGGTEICTSCYYLNEFADRVKAANAPLDFIAASEYSKWDLNGFAPSAPMKDTIQILGKVAQRATGVTTTPVEVHEWGELAFEMYF